MRNKYIYLSLGSFLCGVFIWKIANFGYKPHHRDSEIDGAVDMQRVLVDVAGTPISQEEIDFEFALETSSFQSDEENAEEESEGSDFEYLSLRNYLISSLIERKLLFKFLAADTEFSLSDSSRYVKCLTEWQLAIDRGHPILETSKHQKFYKARLCEQHILKQYLEERVFAKIKMTEEELKEFYQRNKEDFFLPERVIIRQIVLPEERRANRVRNKVKRRNFSWLAKQESITPEAKDGGRLGPFAKGDMPRVFDVVFSMRVGDISQVQKSTYGFHIFMLERKIKAQQMPFSRASKRIERILLEKKRKEEYQKWVEKALHAVTVKVSRSP